MLKIYHQLILNHLLSNVLKKEDLQLLLQTFFTYVLDFLKYLSFLYQIFYNLHHAKSYSYEQDYK